MVSITIDRRAAVPLAILTLVVLAVAIAAGVVLWQATRHVAHLDERTARLDHQLFGAPDRDAPLDDTVSSFTPTLDSIDRRLRAVQRRTRPIRYLEPVSTSLDRVERNTRLIATLPGVLDELRRVAAATELLRPVLDELRRTAHEVGRLRAVEAQLRTLTADLDRLGGSIAGLRPLLVDIREQVREINRKIPTPPAFPAGG